MCFRFHHCKQETLKLHSQAKYILNDAFFSCTKSRKISSTFAISLFLEIWSDEGKWVETCTATHKIFLVNSTSVFLNRHQMMETWRVKSWGDEIKKKYKENAEMGTRTNIFEKYFTVSHVITLPNKQCRQRWKIFAPKFWWLILKIFHATFFY